MGKAPAEQFYWNDWLSDVELQQASACTKGVWINMLCRMWYSNPKGELHGTKASLAKLCICTLEEFDLFLKEAQALLFCYMSRNANGDVTLRNRRMFRQEKDRELGRLRQERFRDKHKSNGDITPPSSPSPSSSNLNYPKKEHFQIPTKEEINESSTPKLKDDLQKLCNHLYENNIFKKAHAFKNKMLKDKKSERAILHTLVRCYLKKEFDTTPWAYCMKIIQVENGNYNEYEYRKDKS